MAVQNLTDITGDNALHNLGTLAASLSLPTRAIWVQLIVTGSGTARFGGGSTSSSVGMPVAAGGGQFLPYSGRDAYYSLGALNVYVPSGATAAIAYEAVC